MTLPSSVTETPETDSDRVSEARPITVSFKTDVQYHEYECSVCGKISQNTFCEPHRTNMLQRLDEQQCEEVHGDVQEIVLRALRRSTKTDKPGVREAALEEAAKVADMFAADHAKSADQFGIDRNRELHNAAKGAAQSVAFAIRALSAPLAAEQSVAEGWKLVPVERTVDMHNAAQSTTGALITRKHSKEIWDAMLAAAPLPRSTTGGAK